MKEYGINLYLSGMLNEKNNIKRGEINRIFKLLGRKILIYEVL